jgi:hypothetical protein
MKIEARKREFLFADVLLKYEEGFGKILERSSINRLLQT